MNDQRWGEYIDIMADPKSIKTRLNDTYSIDFWYKIHYYPLITDAGASRNPTLLTLNDNYRIHYNKGHIYINATANKYLQDEWTHAVIVCGDNSSTASNGVGKLYLNGVSVDSSLDLPVIIDKVKFGQTVNLPWRRTGNPSYVDNIVGAIKIYNRALDGYEVNSNYLSLAGTYGLKLGTVAPYIKAGLIYNFPKKNSNINYNHQMSELQQLSKLFAQLNRGAEAPQIPQTFTSVTNMKCSVPEVPDQNPISDLVMLASNPDFFMKMLRQPEIKLDEAIKKVVLSRDSCSKGEIADILSNPFKTNLLLTYLKYNPKNFMEILNSNIFNVDQLSRLNEALKKMPEGFSDEEESEEYEEALEMLNTYLTSGSGSGSGHKRHHKRHHIPDARDMPQFRQLLESSHTSRPFHSAQFMTQMQPVMQPPQPMQILAESTGKIASMMEQDRIDIELKKQHKRERNLFKRLRNMNKEIKDGNARVHGLEKLLAVQKDLVGILINKTGQCIGAVGKGGKIHKERNSIDEPVNIIMNQSHYQLNIANILKQHQLHNLTIMELARKVQNDKHVSLMGQCINRNHNTIAAIIKYGDETHYIPTVESKILPNLTVVAMIDASPVPSPTPVAAPVAVAKPVKASNPAKPAKVQKPKTVTAAKCTGDKCAAGFKPVPPKFASASWLLGSLGLEVKQPKK